MKNYLVLLFYCFMMGQLHAQSDSKVCYYREQRKFMGKAPIYWKIDGSVKDWQVTLLGKYTGDNNRPFNLADEESNWYYDNVRYIDDPYPDDDSDPPIDLDRPDPKLDFNFFSYINDDYNVYFYFRLLNRPEKTNSFFYFLDINQDGLMSEGEPVVGGYFTNQDILALSLYQFIPDLTDSMYDSSMLGTKMSYYTILFDDDGNQISDEICTPDGYSMKGSLEKIFGSKAIPSDNALQNNEVFAAAVTEGGFGVELSIPWKLLKNWKDHTTPLHTGDVFTYHVSLQKGTGRYSSEKVSDNGRWKKEFFAAKSRVPKFNSAELCYETKECESLNEPPSYCLHMSFKPTDVWKIGIDSVGFSNIEQVNDLPINEEQFTVKVYPDRNCDGELDPSEKPDPDIDFPFIYVRGTFEDQPIMYETYNSELSEDTCFIIHISFPSNNSVGGAIVEITPALRDKLDVYSECRADLGGGIPIPPIKFSRTRSTPVTTRIYPSEKGAISKEAKISDAVLVIPNPNNGNATIKLPQNKGKANIILSDAAGRILQNWQSVTSQTMQVQNLKPGFYVLSITYQNGGEKAVKKLIVQ